MVRRAVVLLALGAVFSCAQPRVADQAQPRSLELHLADHCEAPMPDRLQFQRFPNETPLCAERAYRLDERDFTTASLGSDSIGAPAVNLCFSASGRTKFQRVVSENVGRWIVFLHRGKLLMATKIASADVSQCAMIEGFVDAADAVALQAAINRR